MTGPNREPEVLSHDDRVAAGRRVEAIGEF